MLVVLSDTHATDDPDLVGAAADAVADADLVLHAGDFTTEAVLDGFYDIADDFRAVHGNRDSDAVTDRLPAATTLEYAGVRIAATHRQRGGTTGLAMFGRERGADLVVSGHSHQPSVTRADDLFLLNPGSHADPRGNRPGHAELEAESGTVRGRLREPDGTVFEEFTLPSRE